MVNSETTEKQVALSGRQEGHSAFRRRLFRCDLFSAEHVEITGTDPYDFTWSGDGCYLALHDLRRSDGETLVRSLPRSLEADTRGKMTFLPSGCEVMGWTRPERVRNSYTSVIWNKVALSEEVAGGLRLENLAPRLYFEDCNLLTSMKKLQRFIDDADFLDRMHGETLGLLIAMELVAASRSALAVEEGALPSLKVQQVQDYIEANLSRQLSLAELAAVAGLSRFHFARSFRAATHSSPAEFVRWRRIEKSRELLSSTQLSISSIAAETGFNGIVQFSRAFKKMTGRSPSEFRRLL